MANVPHNWCNPWNGRAIRGCPCPKCGEIRRQARWREKVKAKTFPKKGKE